LQADPFDVNLYIFYRYWIDDDLTEAGYVRHGFRLRHRDWDSPACEPNGGKDYTNPEADPFLRDYARTLPKVTGFLTKLHPGERYYLTNIQAHGLEPADVRNWPDDLWLRPYYVRHGPLSSDWPWYLAVGGLTVTGLVGAGLWWRRRRTPVEA
jgi:hypothetical protein